MALAYPLSGQPGFMQHHGFEVIMISSDGKELPRLLQAEPCKHIVVHMTRKITPLADLKALLRLIKIFRKYRPHIVHTETPKAGLLGMLAAKYSGVKIRIHTIAGLPLMVEKGIKRTILERVEKLTYAAATQVWPNSRSLLNFVLQHKLTAENKLRVIGKGSSNGINTTRFSREALKPEVLDCIKTSFSYDASYTYLLFVGRIVRDKGIIELIDAFVALQNTNPSLKLLLLGHYEEVLDPVPPHIAQQIKSNSGIIHIDWTDSVEYYMAAADYFVFPSYREGFPNVLLEAGAMELPIVCSRIAGNVDIVTHGETGYIFNSQDDAALMEALATALANPGEAKRMAAVLREKVITTYQREIFWEEMLSAYRNLLNQQQ